MRKQNKFYWGSKMLEESGRTLGITSHIAKKFRSIVVRNDASFEARFGLRLLSQEGRFSERDVYSLNNQRIEINYFDDCAFPKVGGDIEVKSLFANIVMEHGPKEEVYLR